MNQKFSNEMDGQLAHRETVARYFSTRTDYWDDVYMDEGGVATNYLGFHMRCRRDAVLKCLSHCHVSGGKILDVGCGSGALMVSMAGMGARVYGMDISPGMVAKAQKCSEGQGVDPEGIILGGVEAIPYDDNSFDVVTCVGVLEYVCDAKLALSELKRVVKKDGRIILTVPNIFKLQYLFDPYYWFVRSFRYIFRDKTRKKNVLSSSDNLGQISTNANYTNKRYSLGQLETILADSSLTPVDWIGLGHGPFTLWRRKLFSEAFSVKTSNALENFFKRVSPGFGKYFANRWVLCLKNTDA